MPLAIKEESFNFYHYLTLLDKITNQNSLSEKFSDAVLYFDSIWNARRISELQYSKWYTYSTNKMVLFVYSKLNNFCLVGSKRLNFMCNLEEEEKNKKKFIKSYSVLFWVRWWTLPEKVKPPKTHHFTFDQEKNLPQKEEEKRNVYDENCTKLCKNYPLFAFLLFKKEAITKSYNVFFKK